MTDKLPCIPEGMTSLIPHLTCANAIEAMDFYKRAFDAVERFKLIGPNGKLMHGSMSLNGGAIMLVDENIDFGMVGPLALNGSPVTMHLFVPDVDASIAKAVAAGAVVTMPAADMFWGDRYGMVKDPYGHSWAMATPQKKLTPEEILAASKAPCWDVQSPN